MLTKDKILKLEALAKKACAIGYAEHGTGWIFIAPGIAVYTADNKNHQSANLEEIKVSLFNPAQIGITRHSIDKVDRIISEVTTALDELQTKMDSRQEDEVAGAKQSRIEALKRELELLEENQ